MWSPWERRQTIINQMCQPLSEVPTSQKTSAPLPVPNELCRAKPGVTPEARSGVRHTRLKLHHCKAPNNAHLTAPHSSALLQPRALVRTFRKRQKNKKITKSTWHFVGTVAAHIRAASAYRAQSATKRSQALLLRVWGMEEIILVSV